MCEILAPAGGKLSALAAINAGANAIYLGLTDFSARSSAENFDLNGFEEISRYAHAFGVKVYVAMNTMVKDSEVEGFIARLLAVWSQGADAIIISDIFLGKFIKKSYPEIILHLSTQAGVCNSYGAQLAKEYGFSRVILSRETAFEDIKSIAKIIDTEVFVQGALCSCFSGQCYMSSFAGGNSGNRGKCKQPCRKLYSIDRESFENMSYKLSLSDLCVGDDIHRYVEAGVTSFKIEGRMRRPEYVAAAVNYYKCLLKGLNSDNELSDLKRTYNRGNYTKGLAFGQDKTFLSSSIQGHIGEFVGIVKVENGKFICDTKQKFVKGDCFKVLRGGKEVGGANYSADCKGGFVLSSIMRLIAGDKVFVTTDTSVNSKLLKQVRTIPVNVSARFLKGKRAEVVLNGEKFVGGVLEEAKSHALTSDNIEKCFAKTDKFPFSVHFDKIETDGVFIALSELNRLRREIFSVYFNTISQSHNTILGKRHSLPIIVSEENKQIAVIGNNKTNFGSAEIQIFKPEDYTGFNADLQNFSGKKFIYLPPYLTDAELLKITEKIENFDGIYCDSVWAIEFAKKFNKPLFAGCGMNISNRVALTECHAEYICLSKELTFAEQARLSLNNTFALSAGSIKVMDLIYCPFSKQCKTCDKRLHYTLIDEAGRKFPLRRYKTDICRFEVFNCADLATVSPTGTLIDCTLLNNSSDVINKCMDEKQLTNCFKNFTRGHSKSPVL